MTGPDRKLAIRDGVLTLRSDLAYHAGRVGKGEHSVPLGKVPDRVRSRPTAKVEHTDPSFHSAANKLLESSSDPDVPGATHVAVVVRGDRVVELSRSSWVH